MIDDHHQHRAQLQLEDAPDVHATPRGWLCVQAWRTQACVHGRMQHVNILTFLGTLLHNRASVQSPEDAAQEEGHLRRGGQAHANCHREQGQVQA